MVSALRALVIVSLVKPDVGLAIAAPAVVAALIFGVFGAVLLYRQGGGLNAETKLGNPFDLLPLLLFAASFAVVVAASSALTEYVGSSGVTFMSGLAGIADVDVASLSAARMAGGSITTEAAATAILMAIASNAMARVAVAFAIGPVGYAAPIFAATVTAVAGGAISYWLLAFAG